MTVGTVHTGTLEIAFESHGDPGGIPLVLLHGYPDDPRCYDAAVRCLAPDGYRIVVPYLRGYGPTRLHEAAPRSGQQAALGADLRDLLEALDLRGAILAGMDWGGRAACIVSALWPERVRGLVSCGGYNIQNPISGGVPADPEQAWRWWYQWYFHSDRGVAALRQDPAGVARQCWRLWSPLMQVDAAEFDRTAASFANPDHAAVVAHSYRHRHGGAAGDPALEPIEQALRARPVIRVPTIVLAPDGDGVAPLVLADTDRDRFGPDYERRIVSPSGHFVPREQPDAFAAAIRDLRARTGA